MSNFPNKAGDHADTDAILTAELREAGIPLIDDGFEAQGGMPPNIREMFRAGSGEVKSSVVGVLHGWQFKRDWRYWSCTGPGIEIETAEALYATHGSTVRVAGHAGSPSPSEWFHGLAVGFYHVDDAAGLKALADTIKWLVTRNQLRQASKALKLT